MTNKSVVIINSLKVPKIKKILLYEMKFLVPNYSCLQNSWPGCYRPLDPCSLCPLSSTEFVGNPPPQTKFLGTPLACIDLTWWRKHWLKLAQYWNCQTRDKVYWSSDAKIEIKPRLGYHPLESLVKRHRLGDLPCIHHQGHSQLWPR